MTCDKCHGNHFYSFRGQIITCECVDQNEITRPRHYTSGGDEPFPFIKSWEMNFAEGNVLKYLVRYKEKGGAVDLEKARWYLDQLIRESKE